MCLIKIHTTDANFVLGSMMLEYMEISGFSDFHSVVNPMSLCQRGTDWNTR